MAPTKLHSRTGESNVRLRNRMETGANHLQSRAHHLPPLRFVCQLLAPNKPFLNKPHIIPQPRLGDLP